jgi:hypothetical protein
MFVSCECLCCQRSLRQTDPSSRGVLPTVVCVWVWSSENKQPRHLLWVGRRRSGLRNETKYFNHVFLEKSNNYLCIILNLQKTYYGISKQWIDHKFVIVLTDWSDEDEGVRRESGEWVILLRWWVQVGRIEQVQRKLNGVCQCPMRHIRRGYELLSDAELQ